MTVGEVSTRLACRGPERSSRPVDRSTRIVAAEEAVVAGLAPVADRGPAQDLSRSGEALGVLAQWVGVGGRVSDHELLDPCELVGVLGRGFVDRVREHAVLVVFQEAGSVPYLDDATDLGTHDLHAHLPRAGREHVDGLRESFPVLGEPEREVNGDRTTCELRRFG